MKHSALRFLVCPTCRGRLQLDVDREEGAEVLEGLLTCEACSFAYPVRGGVPRFVRSSAYASSFGFQWNRFRDVQLDSASGTGESERTLEEVTGWTSSAYRDRLVLDVGVGAGRFAEIVAQSGGEVVGVDLTHAVDAAFANIGRHPRVHVVQADLFAMPFREGHFDLAYSIGVLHHTPDTRAAFARVAAMVQPGGGLAVYLYHRYGPGHRLNAAVRSLTTRLPLPVMQTLAATSVPLYYVYRVPLLGKALQGVAPISLHRNWRWRWLDTFDWYTPRYQWKFLYPEVHRWFRECGFEDVQLSEIPIAMSGTRARAHREHRRTDEVLEALA